MPKKKDPTPPPAPPPGPEPVPTPAPVVVVPVAVTTTVTPDTPIRSIGDIPLDTWAKVLLGSPIQQAGEVTACYDACKGHTAVALATAAKESQYGKTAPSGSHNALGLGPSTHFSTWADGFSNFASRLRLVKPPYVPENISVRTYYQIYVGGPLCPGLLAQGKVCANGEDAASIELYIDQFVTRANGWLGTTPTPTPSPPPAPGYNFGPHPWPPGFDVALLTLPPNGQGWNDLGDRSVPGVMVGTCNHHTAGNDNRDSVRSLFNVGGGRFGQAMTDAVIDRTGKGYLLIDPWGASKHVTPWASGPATALKGPGVPFVQQLGANAVNKRLFSTEHCHAEGQTFTDAQLDLSAKVHAVVICNEHIPWDQWPHNPAIGGLMVALVHRDFAPTSCPSDEWVKNVYPHWVEAVRAEAKRLQGGGVVPPGPVPTFDGLTIDTSVFLKIFPRADPNGLRTKYYLAHWVSRGEYPTMLGEATGSDGAAYTWFSGGQVLRYKDGVLTQVGPVGKP